MNALVISGGGSKGAFAVGAIRYLRETLKLSFDMIAGTSTGALIAPLVVTDELALLEQIYTTVHTTDILKSPTVMQDVINRGYYFDTAPLEALVKKTFDITRTQKILDAPVPVFLTTTCLQTGRTTYFQTGQLANPTGPANADLIPVTDRATFISAVIASANQPILMPPIAIGPAQPLREYVDGGVREYAPINIAITNGATDVYVVMHSPAPGTDAPIEGRMAGMLKVAARTISLLSEEVGANDLRLTEIYSYATRYLEQIRTNATTLGLSTADITQLFAGSNPFVGRRAVNLHVIRPDKDFPTEGLEFDPAVMTDLVGWGGEAAKDLLG